MTQNGVDRSGAAGGTGASVTPIDENIIDAKGDLIVGTADNTAARKAVGANDTMLMADSAESTGVKWATPEQVGTAVIGGQTEETAVALADLLPMLDVSPNPDVARKITVQNVLKALNLLTEDTAPDTADFLLSYDVSASDVKKVKPENLPIGRKNVIINGDFNVWQRSTSNTSTSTASQYAAPDRWHSLFTAAAVNWTISRQTFTLGQTDVPGEPAYFCRVQVNSSTTPTDIRFGQRIEGVRTLAGRAVTVSFYAKADSARTITPALVQHFGTGGAPSADVSTGLTACDLTASWQKFTRTVTVPSISGKTLGSAGNDYLDLRFAMPNANFTIDFSRVQVEPGSVATNFEYRSLAEEIALCQRYFEKSYDMETAVGSGVQTGGTHIVTAAAAGTDHFSDRYKVEKRGTPTIVLYSQDGATGVVNRIGVGNTAATAPGACTTSHRVNFTAVDGNGYMWQWTADAEL